MKRVLLVHSDADMLQACRRALEHAHFEPVLANNFADALRLTCTAAPDLIFIARMRPSDAEALKIAAPHTPVLASVTDDWSVATIVSKATHYLGPSLWRDLPKRSARPTV